MRISPGRIRPPAKVGDREPTRKMCHIGGWLLLNPRPSGSMRTLKSRGEKILLTSKVTRIRSVSDELTLARRVSILRNRRFGLRPASKPGFGPSSSDRIVPSAPTSTGFFGGSTRQTEGDPHSLAGLTEACTSPSPILPFASEYLARHTGQTHEAFTADRSHRAHCPVAHRKSHKRFRGAQSLY